MGCATTVHSAGLRGLGMPSGKDTCYIFRTLNRYSGPTPRKPLTPQHLLQVKGCEEPQHSNRSWCDPRDGCAHARWRAGTWSHQGPASAGGLRARLSAEPYTLSAISFGTSVTLWVRVVMFTLFR